MSAAHELGEILKHLEETSQLSAHLTRTRWLMALGNRGVADDGSAHRLVTLLLDAELGTKIRALPNTALGWPLLLVLTALGACRCAMDPRITRHIPAPAADNTLSSKDAAEWAAAVNSCLLEEYGFDPVSTALLARGLDPSRAADWLARVITVLRSLALEQGPVVTSEAGALAAQDLLRRLRFPDALWGDVPVDYSAEVSVARSYAYDIPKDVRIVVPDRHTHVGLLRTLLHEYGHVAYFRLAPGVGVSPWMFEPACGPEAAAFALEFVGAAAESADWLAKLAHDILHTVKAAQAEVLLRAGLWQEVEWEFINARQLTRQPWFTLDHALARLTGLATAMATTRMPLETLGRVVIEQLLAPGPQQPWSFRHNALLSAVDEVRFSAPTETPSEVIRYRGHKRD